MNHDKPARRPTRRDSGDVLLELALVTALIALVVVAILGLVARNLPTL